MVAENFVKLKQTGTFNPARIWVKTSTGWVAPALHVVRTDPAAYSAGASDSLMLSPSVLRQVNLQAKANDSLGFTENITSLVTGAGGGVSYSRNVPDSVTLADVATKRSGRHLTIADSINFADVMTRTIGSGGIGYQLTWRPPTGWESYTPVTINTNGTLSMTLSNGVDYKLIAPNAPITGPVVITGGRNIVWIGGFLGGRTSQPALNTTGYDSANRGIRINSGSGSANRIIYIEGIQTMLGSYFSDFLQVYSGGAPVSGMTLYVQNILSHGWHWGTNVTTPNVHADVIQFYSGPTNFFLDRLTADHCTYQGLYLDAMNYGGTPGGTKLPWEVKHVNLYREATGGTGYPGSQPLGLNSAASWANVQNTQIYTNGGFKSVASFGGWPINSELHENANPPGGDFVSAACWNNTTYTYTSPGYI